MYRMPTDGVRLLRLWRAPGQRGITVSTVGQDAPQAIRILYEGGQWVDNPDYDPAAPKMDGDWLNWNPKKIWVPSKEGLGMKYVFDQCNELYGKDFIRYE